MPLIPSAYISPVWLPGGDLQTAAPALFRRVTGVKWQRERITTPDSDFLDIDCLPNLANRTALLIHGLEASTHNPYMMGMAKSLLSAGYQIAAMNLRGCSGEPNVQVRSYHSGATDDLDTVIKHLLKKYPRCELSLVGFSLGGNLVLKYLGEKGKQVDRRVKSAVTISVPSDLRATAENLDRWRNAIYMNRFLRSLKPKLYRRIGKVSFPLSKNKIRSIRSLVDFDNTWTAPVNGFKDAFDYYEKCSAKQFIESIRIPTYILTAKNDPFFTTACMPYDECVDHPNVFLETPDEGGHVGFCIGSPYGKYYSEIQAAEFLHKERF